MPSEPRTEYADDAARDGGDLVVPFGGTDVAAGPARRRNTCANCPRSMSDRWQGDLCPFCKDALVCDHCGFEAANLRGLASHHRQAHPHRRTPEVLR